MAMDELGLRLWIYLLMGGVLLGGALKKLLAWQATLAGWLGVAGAPAAAAAAALWVRLPALLPLLALLLALLLLLLFVLPGVAGTRRPAALPARGKAVLITGCDSGFGRAAARALDAAGMEVFATVLDLSGEGARELRGSCSPRLTLLQVDITQPQQVQQALAQVQARLATRGLWGLVNNAGVCVNFGDTELSLMSNFRGCMEVNFFGTLNVTKSFLPMLRQARGRIVNVSSPAGDQPFPCLAAYGASKAALNLLTDTLRHEMEPWGVQVSTILPSSYKTGQASNAAYWERQHQQLLQSLPPALLDEYGRDYVTETKELFLRHALRAQPDLRPVVDAIAEALLTPRPRHRYLVGPGVGLMYFIHTYCPFSLSNRFLQRLFVEKKLPPRALRRRSAAAAAAPTDCQLALLLNNNNNDGEDKLK